ncbi:crotonase/enoyl-CoA hydratase family protein [Rhodococcus sp. NPDC019627]|uniref:crotonase/enoyl-CoA hydratase family protein n=1 Tax=unclassified Rhodococcus (in: high G+C Gram-positive bacteria) TaxID=192944 RepID=UPI0033C05122
MNEERVRIRVGDNGVATVAMVRRDKHNALDRAMFEGLRRAASQLADDRKIRAVVLYGEGKSFCSGLDIPSFLADPVGGIEALLVREHGHAANFAQRAAYDWSCVPVPVIAAISGHCFGGGLQIALGADIRIAAPDASLSIMEVRWGLVPDMAITQSLPRIVAIDVAKELTFTGRIVSGAEGEALGLVTRTADDPLASALALAEEIAQKSPDAVRAVKHLYDQTWAGTDAAAALVLETDLQRKLYGSPNQIAAVTAGMAKRPPVFVDPDQ